MKNKLLMLLMLFLCTGMASNAQIDSCNNPVNLVTNGDFTAGNTGFTSGLISSCACTANSYCVNIVTTNKCAGWTSFNAPAGSGNFLLIDGNQSNPAVAWAQTGIAVTPNTWYTFSFMARNIYTINLFNLEFRINDGTTTDIIPTTNITGGAWNQYTTTWFSGSATTVDLDINIPSGGGYRDFGMDDIFFGYCNDCQPNADFDVTYLHYNPCQFPFTDLSTSVGANIIGWHWDFGDGTTSNLQNPVHYFPTAGTYNVCLTIMALNASGECCTDKICKKVVSNCPQSNCNLKITGIDLVPDECDPCTYSLSGGVYTSRPVTSWFWQFDDGTTSTEENPVHSFGPGAHTVCLTAVSYNSAGICCTDRLCLDFSCDSTGGKFSNPGQTSTGMQNDAVAKSFPNPFSNELNIEVTVKGEKSQKVTLSVYDAAGRLVSTEVKESVFTPGAHQLSINTSSWNEGIYFYTVTIGEERISGKAIRKK